ncbi:sensor histidine kinase [Dialister sp.]|uniref:sensor histidine kinase n=1 Tax=Dialister sp. TaxID=1955814 RepID=UPI002E8050A1|nr:HAMP domain-containing sensor histidine kinase [Dialister sp.]MEE3452348.1 HAMP domain-containing sensor histidine kinase [Dialister sp.]
MNTKEKGGLPEKNHQLDNESAQSILRHKVVLSAMLFICVSALLCIAALLSLFIYARMEGITFNPFVDGLIIVTILLILFISLKINISFYRYMQNSIIIPLQQLSLAAHAIQYRNYNVVVDHYSRDEIGEACSAFRTMQLYLKNSIAERAMSMTSRKIVFSGIAHDLRTPLTTIMGYTEALQLGMAKTPEKQQQYLESIASCTDDLSKLIDELSLYNKLSTSRVICHPHPANFSQVIRNFINEDKQYLNSRNVTVTYDTDESLTALIDKKEFQRVIFNLLSNTVKYREKDSSNVLITIKKSGHYAEFSFKDDGPGIPSQKLPHIFEAFYRTDEARSRTSNGSGLGLAIVAEIITAHKGRYHATSENGLKIIFDIPLAEGSNVE